MLLFGALSDLAGWRQRDVDCSSLTNLRALLGSGDPRLGEALIGPGVQVALDQVLVRGDAMLTASSEVAFLPPMSGG